MTEWTMEAILEAAYHNISLTFNILLWNTIIPFYMYYENIKT